jgi:hypothetical protein
MEAERHTLRAVATTGLLAEFTDTLYDIRWLFIIMGLLIIADLYYGISESRKRFTETGEQKYKVRLSRAGRRTLNKTVDYLCYVVISGVLAKAEAEPYGVDILTVASICCLFIIVFELSSIIGHICYLHGIPYHFNPRVFLISLIKKKDEALGEATDEALTEKKDEKDNT